MVILDVCDIMFGNQKKRMPNPLAWQQINFFNLVNTKDVCDIMFL
jgi:hypothetical protein